VKVAFVTPVDRRSAIARVSLEILRHLGECTDITVFAEPTDQPIRVPYPTRPASEAHDSLAGFDRVVTVIGDSPFHRNAFQLACRRPTLVILHDVVVAHLAVHLYGPLKVIEEVHRWNPGPAAARAEASLATAEPFWVRKEVVDTPLFEMVLEKADGVITHSEFAAAQLRSHALCPVRVLPLPYVPLAPGQRVPQQGARLLTLGYANANKCHELVIEALCELGRDDVEYVIAGAIDAQRRRHLEGLASSLGLSARVRIVGEIPDDQLRDLLANTTISVNLRQPPMEAASASVLEQMSAGTPTVVFDHGCYAELPDHTVCKVPVTIAPMKMAEEIGGLLADPERCKSIGEAGRRYVAEIHRGDTYAAGLIDFLDEVDSYGPYRDLAQNMASAMQHSGTTIESPLATRWAAYASAMLARPR
jgi:glycosyltransferase involved in cell wall biosynthesis